MYTRGADVIFHAAGATGTGVIEAAHEEGAYAIGVDMDQSYLSPTAVLTSALKRVDQAIFDLTPRLISGELAGGTDVTLHLADGDYLGIPEEHDLMPEGVYEDALQVIELIRQGEVVPPASQDSYDAFMASL
jgi:basic membrane protein A